MECLLIQFFRVQLQNPDCSRISPDNIAADIYQYDTFGGSLKDSGDLLVSFAGDLNSFSFFFFATTNPSPVQGFSLHNSV
jgi:hypothetical protein